MGGHLAGTASTPEEASGLGSEAVAVATHQVTLVQFLLEHGGGSIAETADLNPFFLTMVVIKDQPVRGGHLQTTIQALLPVQFALEKSLTARLVVGGSEARATQVRRLGLVEGGGLGGLAHSTGSHLESSPEEKRWKKPLSFSIPMALRFRRMAVFTEANDPAVGSSTVSPSLLYRVMSQA
jgi:hypothetical protein